LQTIDVLIEGGDHDDRRVAAPPQLGQHLPAVNLRHLEVQKNQIGFKDNVLIERSLAIRSTYGPESFPHQICVQNLGDFRLIFRNQNKFVHVW
jgi:hypothetical protein